jgi:rubrerythrin
VVADITKKNLKEAFAGESQANRRYVAFAQKALQEGFPNVARLFRAVAESETIHAYNHLLTLDGIRSTLENVEEAWKGEKHEYTSMYPMFMDQAKRDADSEALRHFSGQTRRKRFTGNSMKRLPPHSNREKTLS